jgi:hypothetical protein
MKFWLITNTDNNKKILTRGIEDATYVLTEYPNCKMEEVELWVNPKPMRIPDVKTMLKD